MAVLCGAEADSSGQPSSSIPASITSVGRTFKRKHEGDDVGSPVISASESRCSKRQKHGTGYFDAAAMGSGREVIGSRGAHPPVRHVIYQY